MITPWSTNAVEITQNMGISGIERIEEFDQVASENVAYDPMLQVLYRTLDQALYNIDAAPEHVQYIEDISTYNTARGASPK